MGFLILYGTFTGTKTLASTDTGTTDLGESHTYRYVNASNVYTYGTQGTYTNTLNKNSIRINARYTGVYGQTWDGGYGLVGSKISYASISSGYTYNTNIAVDGYTEFTFTAIITTEY